MKRLVWILIIGLLAFCTAAGCWNGWREVQHSVGFWPRVVAALTFSYGIAGAASLLMLLLKRGFAFWPILIWASLTTACATTAVIVFGPPDQQWTVVLASFLSLLAIFIPILIFVRKNLPRKTQ